MKIQTVSILGVGLIGGSFGLALRAAGFTGRILGVSSPRTIDSAVRHGAIDAGMPLAEAVGAADLVYLAQPIGRIVELLPEVARHAAPGCLVTDAGSTKRAIVARAAEVFAEGPWFLGGHPMAGKAQRGVELAEADLFAGAVYVLTPHNGRLPDTPVVQEFVAWIRKFGATPSVLPPDVHDEVVTWTSHLPQLVSSALALSVSGHLDDAEHLKIAGPGLRDMTRLAESSYAIWKDILSTNGDNLQTALHEFIIRLKHFSDHLGTSDLQSDFESAKKIREKLFPS
ncbi:MAG: prephenate dehydrogenase [Bryobacterales bacterium]